MQNSSGDETKEIIPQHMQSKTHYSNEDLTFSKSPSKRLIKLHNLNKNIRQSLQAKLYKSINDDKTEEKSQIFEKNSNFHEISTMLLKTKSENRGDNLLKEMKEDEEKEIKAIPSGIKPRIVAPKSNYAKNENLENLTKISPYDTYDLQDESNFFKKKKKEWKSWSSQEKELFYEAIANGVNYSSLQKLFKNMNNKIGTKSTEKIRDYYYRALKNVNKLLKSVGDSGINGKNRDEVLLALNCYGKMITSSNSKKNSQQDVMKKLNKHPRLFKKTALSLKKLIMRGIKQMRTIKLNEKSQRNNKNRYNSKNMTFKKDYKMSNNFNPNEPQMKIIDTEICRKIPYDKFIVRITPHDYETYFKMIESNYSPRIEIIVPFNKSIKQIIEILQEKWKCITKKYKNFTLFLCPLEDLWIPNEISFFSAGENSKAYDIGDIFTGYGCPSTNTFFMQYQWNESPVHKNQPKNSVEARENYLSMLKDNFNHDLREKNKSFRSSNNSYIANNLQNEFDNPLILSNFNNASLHNNISNSLIGQPDICEGSPKDSLNNSQVKVEDFLSSVNESDDEKEKSFVPLEQEYDEFDPLEFLGIYNLAHHTIGDNAISSDGEIDEDLDFILDDYDYVGKDKHDKINQMQKPENALMKNEKKVSSFNSPNKNNNNNKDDNENINGEENDPYKRIDYFSKMRKTNPEKEENCGLNAFTISECHSNLSNNQNIVINNRTNGNQLQNQHDSLNIENYNKMLSFNDLNSKIKSNTLTLNSSSNNVNDGKNEKDNKIMINFSLEKISNSKDVKQIKNNKISVSMNLKKLSPTTPKRVTKRIPFINNQIQSSENASNTMLNFTNKNEYSKLASNKVNTSNESNKDNNLNLFTFPQNEYNHQLTSILKNINSSAQKEKIHNEKREEIPLFNAENSNLLNYSNNHIGLFDHESNMNILRNPYNNSMFFNDNMFYSNNLNSMFVRNNEDSMMKVINSSYFRETRDNKIKEANAIINDTANNINSKNSDNLDQAEFNKPLEAEKNPTYFNKKTNRNKCEETKGLSGKKSKKKRRSEPMNLDEFLDESERTSKTTEYKSEMIKKKKKEVEKESDPKFSNGILEGCSKLPIKANQTNNPANTQNINISNTNPYIINQNNYFNAYNPSLSRACPQIGENKQKVSGNPGHFIPRQNNKHLDIPHPNKFINPNYNMNYQFNPMNNIQNPIIDPQYMMNYQMRMPGMYYFGRNPREQAQNNNFKNSK